MNTFREISQKLPSAVGEEIRQLPDAFLSEVEELRLRQAYILLKCGMASG